MTLFVGLVFSVSYHRHSLLESSFSKNKIYLKKPTQKKHLQSKNMKQFNYERKTGI